MSLKARRVVQLGMAVESNVASVCDACAREGLDSRASSVERASRAHVSLPVVHPIDSQGRDRSSMPSAESWKRLTESPAPCDDVIGALLARPSRARKAAATM